MAARGGNGWDGGRQKVMMPLLPLSPLPLVGLRTADLAVRPSTYRNPDLGRQRGRPRRGTPPLRLRSQGRCRPPPPPFPRGVTAGRRPTAAAAGGDCTHFSPPLAAAAVQPCLHGGVRAANVTTAASPSRVGANGACICTARSVRPTNPAPGALINHCRWRVFVCRCVGASVRKYPPFCCSNERHAAFHDTKILRRGS